MFFIHEILLRFKQHSLIVLYIVRPYNYKHPYALSTGENCLVIVSNIIAEIYNGKVSLYGTIALIILPLVPVIVSYYLYLIFDYGSEIDENESKDLHVDHIMTLLHCVLIFGGLFYGAFIVYQLIYMNNVLNKMFWK